ncbi:hypothetical protein M0811_12559 [Anaeramoeba ignava]|uniref:Fibronectin type-III domain-containing protein n=1 Tax=Anaeramoeba ignava TaxID=1746090 RepID=A0A9Q0R6V0_ANAIG|nr:hypothetical protein M0811_12559 [Anaeramoeba ignava]
MQKILLLLLLINLILSQSIQNEEISLISESKISSEYLSSSHEGYVWNLTETLIGEASSRFGYGVAIYQDVFVVGATYTCEAYVYRKNGSNWDLEQILNGTASSNFGYGVAIYQDVIIVGASLTYEVFIYRYNGTIWNLEEILNGTADSGFGTTVAIYDQVIVIGCLGDEKAYIYRYNGTNWNPEQSLDGTAGSGFGICASIYDEVIAIGATFDASVYVYRYNVSNWDLEQILNGTLGYGYGDISIYENVIAFGSNSFSEPQVSIYRYNGSIWNLEEILNGTADSGLLIFMSQYMDVLGIRTTNQFMMYEYNQTTWNLKQTFNVQSTNNRNPISIYGNFTILGTYNITQVFIYEAFEIPQVNILNCSSLFSSFDCYWDEVEFFKPLKYQINYGFDWIDIDSPILEDGNVYYQQFNSSIYDNLISNENYPIQIHACDIETMICGKSVSFVNLTTRIDSIDEGIPHLDHYNISYFNQSEPESIFFISVDNSSTSYILNDIECGKDYNISIWGCRTQECEGEDKGKVSESSISIIFEDVHNISCSVSYSLDINCTWDQINICSIPSYYHFSYQSISQNDSGNYQPTLTNQKFTAQFPNQEYQIGVSGCDSENNCGVVSTISITTGYLPSAPIINEIIPKIEEIEFNFTKLTYANNYSISLDNGTNWQNFTSLYVIVDNIIGILSGIPGNVEYNISIRGCSDLNCETPYFGEPSLIESRKAKLGNIHSLSCYGIDYGFVCNWDPLQLTEGLEAYSFRFNLSIICLQDLRTSYSVSGLPGGANYQIAVYSSANDTCYYDTNSGIESIVLVTTLIQNQETDNKSKNAAIALGVILPVFVIAAVIFFIILIKKQKNSIKRIIKQREKELEKSGGIELI